MTAFQRYFLLLLTGLLAWGLFSISSTENEHDEETELAPYMGNLQRFSQKLGYAVSNRNQRLTAFYLEEIEEVLEDLEKVEEHDGFPVGSTVKTIMGPIVGDFDKTLEKKDFAGIEKSYITMIDGCNRCHAALEHEFIVITPAQGNPPYNQKF